MMTQPTRPVMSHTRFRTLTAQLMGQSWAARYIKQLPIIRTVIFRRAIRQAFHRFAEEHPEWVASLFDEHFLSRQVPLMEARYRAEGMLPSPIALAIAWDRQVGPASTEIRQRRIREVTPAAADFIEWLTQALDAL